MPASPTASPEEIRDVNTRYHDGAAAQYDAKWGIDYGEVGQGQVLGKVRKLVPATPGAYGDALEIGAGTGYFALNMLQAGVIATATCTDISEGMLETLRGNADGSASTCATVACDAEALPFEDASFDLVMGHAVLHHLPDLDQAFREFRRVLRPGGTVFFAGEPSRVGDRIASYPKRWAWKASPVWRRAIGARKGARGPQRRRRGEPHARARRRRPRVRPGRPRAARPRRRPAGRHRARRGAAGQLVRVDQPRAGVLGRGRGHPDGLAPVRLPRLPRLPAGGPPPARAAACPRGSSTTSC